MFGLRIAPPLAAALLLAGLYHAWPSRAADIASVKPAVERQPASEFALKDADGKVVHLSGFRGKVVLLDFWATWCIPCKVEIPWFTEIAHSHANQDFAVLGVAMDDEGWEVVKPFVASLKMDYPVVVGDDPTAERYGGVDALPTTFLIDRQGRIAAIHQGITGKDRFIAEGERLLAE